MQLRLATGRDDLDTAGLGAGGALDGFDAALNFEVKREMMLDGTVVLRMGG